MPDEMKKAMEEASKKAGGTVQVVSLPAATDGKAASTAQASAAAAGTPTKAEGAVAAAAPVVPVEYATKVGYWMALTVVGVWFPVLGLPSCTNCAIPVSGTKVCNQGRSQAGRVLNSKGWDCELRCIAIPQCLHKLALNHATAHNRGRWELECNEHPHAWS
jgi:hypothetical protein